MANSIELEVLGMSFVFFGLILAVSSRVLGSISRAATVISTLHAFNVFYRAGYTVLIECWNSSEDYCFLNSTSNSAFQQRTALISLGYFLADFLPAYLKGVSLTIHHIASAAGLGAVIWSGASVVPTADFPYSFTGSSCYAISCFLFLADMQAPFLDAFTSGLTRKKPKADMFARVMFACCFVLGRLIISPILGYEYIVNSTRGPMVARLACFIINLLGFYWAKFVFAGIVKASSQARKKE
jgi:hypothetical protein